MKISLVSFNPTVGKILQNTDKILAFVDQAIAKHCDLVIFPELAMIGYPPKDYLYFDRVKENQTSVLLKLKRKSKKITIVAGGIATHKGEGLPLKNCAYVFQNGQQYQYAKRLLPNYDVFDERRYFEPGDEILKIKIGGKKFGFTICEDIWYQEEKLKNRYPQNPLADYAGQNLDYLINISASPFEVGKKERRVKQFSQVAEQLNCSLIYVNQVGANDDIIFDGGALIFDHKGQIVFQAENFCERLFIFDTEKLQPQKINTPPEAEQIRKALTLGIRDYVHKSGFSQVLLGLSGGVDSALVAVLATEALGADNVLGVILPSRYSHPSSETDALNLAKNLKIKTQTIAIEPIHKMYEESFEKIFGPGQTKDITAQNIQARIRGNILMAIANNTGRLLLNTTNKSEMAMGYGTLYGDMCGALAVLSDVSKTRVYQLCHHINKDHEVIPKNTLEKEPSAELKPNQKDSDSLPPYNVLDPILQQFVETQNIPPKPLPHQVDKILNTVMINEYKRDQAPIGLKITEKAFGVGRRMPIVGNLL